MNSSPIRHCTTAIALALTLLAPPAHAEQDLTPLPLEQLLEIKVTSASKFEQITGDAPSSVQIISRDEIQRHGWRTLTEALNTLPGLYASNDRVYDFQGTRGFQIPGDYNTRFLLLVDGQPNNDNIFNSGMTGSESWLDMSVIERIEYIPGPGSAIYGSSAMFGVVNLITRRASTTPKNQVGMYVSQLGASGINILGSKVLTGAEQDTGLFLQYSAEHQSGRDRNYIDPLGQLVRGDNTVSPDGVAHGLDYGRNHHLLVRADHGEWSFKLINHERTIHPSSAPYVTVFDDPAMTLVDGGTQLNASVQHELSDSSSIHAKLGYTDWYYRATYPYLDGVVGYYHNYDDDRGQTLDGEFDYQLRSGAHHLLAGLEISRDLKASQRNFNSVPAASLGTSDVNINPLIQRNGLFVQDEWRLNSAWLLSMGLRFDKATSSRSTSSPRLGLIWHPAPAWSLKLLAGRAYRSPSAYESQFGNGLTYLSNLNLRPETIRTEEGVVEWLSDEQTRWQFSLYNNQILDLIQQVDTGAGVLQFQNVGKARVHGFELGVEKSTTAGLMLRASLAANHSHNALDARMDNSPDWIAKTSASVPLFNYLAYLAGEIQLVGSRTYTWNAAPYSTPIEALVNTTVTFPNVFAKGLQAQIRISNLLDRNIRHPASAEMLTPEIPQNRRNLSATLSHEF